MKPFADMDFQELLRKGGWDCDCGRHHRCGLGRLYVERGAVRRLPEALAAFHKHKPFVVCDRNTKAAAWVPVRDVLESAGIPYTLYTFSSAEVEPDEHAVGSLTMSFDRSCDVILAIGSGVINDCCKVLGYALGMPSMVVGTAPSMEGYASNSSSMIQNRVKVSLLKSIVDAAPRLMERDPDTIGTVVRGLVHSGAAMAFAEISRPASGLEHYFSHLWEMMALDRGTPSELHGIQASRKICPQPSTLHS